MKNVRVVIITLLSCYVFIVSFFLFANCHQINKYMKEEVSIKKDENYEKFLVEARYRIEKYYKKAKTKEDRNCVLSVKKIIDKSDALVHPIGKTNKDLFDYYTKYNEESILYDFSNALRTCKFTDEQKSKHKNWGKIMGVVGFYDIYYSYYKYMNKSIGLTYKLSETSVLNFLLTSSDIANIQVNSIKKNLRQTDELLAIDNQIDSINEILDMVGEKYDKK